MRGEKTVSLGGPGIGLNVDEERCAGVRGGVKGAGEAGCWTRRHQCGAHGVADEVMDEAGLTEADFGFGGVHVDVDLLRGGISRKSQDDGVGGERR